MRSVINPHSSKLRWFNNFLTLVVVGLSLYIMIFPFLPYLGLWVEQNADSTDGYKYKSALSDAAGIKSESLPEPPSANTLVVPSIAVDGEVFESQDASALQKGIWRRPHTSTPDQGGNSVFVAHRFSYDDPSVFYHLDKMKANERFVVFWEGYEYVYETFEINIVTPDQIQIESPTIDPIITLYTCTPIWTAKDRLVVKANLVETDNPKFRTSEPNESSEGSPLLNNSSGLLEGFSALPLKGEV